MGVEREAHRTEHSNESQAVLEKPFVWQKPHLNCDLLIRSHPVDPVTPDRLYLAVIYQNAAGATESVESDLENVVDVGSSKRFIPEPFLDQPLDPDSTSTVPEHFSCREIRK